MRIVDIFYVSNIIQLFSEEREMTIKIIKKNLKFD
jgi:hypothetical protein